MHQPNPPTHLQSSTCESDGTVVGWQQTVGHQALFSHGRRLEWPLFREGLWFKDRSPGGRVDRRTGSPIGPCGEEQPGPGRRPSCNVGIGAECPLGKRHMVWTVTALSAQHPPFSRTFFYFLPCAQGSHINNVSPHHSQS